MELINKILTFLNTWKMKLNGFLVNAESVIDQTQDLIGANKPDQVASEEPEAIEPKIESMRSVVESYDSLQEEIANHTEANKPKKSKKK
jgi:hypothetical protein